MDDITIRMVLTALVVLITNAVTIRHVMKDVNKNHRDIKSLFKMNNHYMTRQEIGELYAKSLSKLETDTSDTNKLVHEMKEQIARMDERMKGSGTGTGLKRRATD